MNVEFNKSDIYQFQSKISLSKPLRVKIIDRIEGNINLEICVSNDSAKNKSYTRYHVLCPHQAEILIFNPDITKYTSTEKPILLGSYNNNKHLFMEFVLEPRMSDGYSMVRLKFFIKNKNLWQSTQKK
ncbi:hypothetical protein JQM83_13885 [Parabacteroides distasonis]|nr:hypothetical protein [Parabacteroides distasonis]